MKINKHLQNPIVFVFPLFIQSGFGEDQAGQHFIEKSEIEDARNVLNANLADPDLTPEKRATLIESWLKENQTLLSKEGSTETTAHVRPPPIGDAAEITKRLELIEETRKVDPLLADILEIEDEIKVFTKSLDQSAPTPEERAVRVEAFLELNKASLAGYDELKFQLGDRIAAKMAEKSKTENISSKLDGESEPTTETKELDIEKHYKIAPNTNTSKK